MSGLQFEVLPPGGHESGSRLLGAVRLLNGERLGLVPGLPGHAAIIPAPHAALTNQSMAPDAASILRRCATEHASLLTIQPSGAWTARWRISVWRTVWAGMCAVVALTLLYSGLAVYKAFQYTTSAQPPFATTPADLGLPYESVTFRSAASDALPLSGWWIPKSGSSRAVILVHGRYQNRTTYLSLAKPLWIAGFNVLLFDLRGHGRSPPAPCTYGIQEQWDVVGAVRFARGRGMPAGSIGVIGWSLGAASALMAMRDDPDIGAVVSDSAYANADPLLARNPLRPGLALALRLVRGVDLRRVSPEEAIRHRDGRPVFLIHGARDDAVPLSQAYRLERAAGKDAVTL